MEATQGVEVAGRGCLLEELQIKLDITPKQNKKESEGSVRSGDKVYTPQISTGCTRTRVVSGKEYGRVIRMKLGKK